MGAGMPASEMTVSDAARGKAEALAGELPGLAAAESNESAALCADIIIMAVKPDVLAEALRDVADAARGKLVVSIAAGRSLAFIESCLREGQAAARVMPNVNALVGQAMSAVCVNARVTAEQKAAVLGIFSVVGRAVELDEKLMPAFVGLSGSAPAYVYMLIDAMALAGVRAGLPRRMAETAAAQAVLGSAQTVLSSGLHPRQLSDMVCSPGGTTIEGVAALIAGGYEAAIMAAVGAVAEKDRALSGR
jgi:pyrroline-5-carboxylate reductase